METIQSFPEIGEGDTFPAFQFKLKDPDIIGSYIDLTGYIFCVQLKNKPQGKLYHEFVYDIAGDTATFDDWSVDIKGGTYYLDIKVTDTLGDVVHTSKFKVPIIETISSC